VAAQVCQRHKAANSERQGDLLAGRATRNKAFDCEPRADGTLPCWFLLAAMDCCRREIL